MPSPHTHTHSRIPRFLLPAVFASPSLLTISSLAFLIIVVGSRTRLGLLWLLLHPIVTISTGELACRRTYFFENALLLGSTAARRNARDASLALEHAVAYASLPTASDRVWLENQLRAIPRVRVDKQPLRQQGRVNVVGILQASPLADSKESVVLVVELHNTTSDVHADGEQQMPSVALALALLSSLSQASWLAKMWSCLPRGLPLGRRSGCTRTMRIHWRRAQLAMQPLSPRVRVSFVLPSIWRRPIGRGVTLWACWRLGVMAICRIWTWSTARSRPYSANK